VAGKAEDLRPCGVDSGVFGLIPAFAGRGEVRSIVGRFAVFGRQKVSSSVFPMIKTPTIAIIAFRWFRYFTMSASILASQDARRRS